MFRLDAAGAAALDVERIDDVIGSGEREAAAQCAAFRSRLAVERLVFLDETGVQSRTSQRTHDRAPRGSGPIRPVQTYRRSRNQSAGVAVAHGAGVLARRVVAGGFNRERFVAFLRGELRDAVAAWPRDDGDGAPRFTLIMDNASIHHGGDVRRVVEDELGGTIEYLPPYAPTFNPCECAFAKLKAVLRRRRWDAACEAAAQGGVAEEAALRRHVEEALREVRPADVQGWFRLGGWRG